MKVLNLKDINKTRQSGKFLWILFSLDRDEPGILFIDRMILPEVDYRKRFYDGKNR